MKLNKKVKARLTRYAMPLLPEGTQVRQIMYVQTRSFGGMLLSFYPDKYGMIAVTDDAVYVLDCGRSYRGYYGYAKPKKVLGVLPRTVRFGPLKGLTSPVVFASPWRMINGYYDEARTADEAADHPTGLQPVL
jgi:hypothetical protein